MGDEQLVNFIVFRAWIPLSHFSGEQLDGVARRVLSDADSEYDQLTKENVNTILSYGDAFMDTVCRDACDGHDVGRVSMTLRPYLSLFITCQ